jgi:NitT/TauT family transport system permease protein
MSAHQAILDKALREAVARDRQDRLVIWGGRAAILIGFLSLWQFSSGRLVDRDFISSPLDVARAWWALAENGTLVDEGLHTAGEFVAGYFLGALTGVVAAVALTWRGFAYRVAEPYLFVFYSLPKLALAPLIGLWFGLGASPKIVLAAVVTCLLVIINLVAGIRAVKPDLLGVMQIMGAGKLQAYRQLIIPFSIPYVLTALRFGIPFSMIAVILAEFIGSYHGLGHVIAEQAAFLNVDTMMALVVTLAAFVAVFRLMLLPLERWVSRHHL